MSDPVHDSLRTMGRFTLFALALLTTGTASVALAHGWPGRPQTNPPRLSEVGPPPAWVETRQRSRWLSFSSYCWRKRHEGDLRGHGAGAGTHRPWDSEGGARSRASPTSRVQATRGTPDRLSRLSLHALPSSAGACDDLARSRLWGRRPRRQGAGWHCVVREPAARAVTRSGARENSGSC